MSGPLTTELLVPGMPERIASGEGWEWGRDALEGKGSQRRPQKRLDRRLEEVAKRLGAVTVGYKCH